MSEYNEINEEFAINTDYINVLHMEGKLTTMSRYLQPVKNFILYYVVFPNPKVSTR